MITKTRSLPSAGQWLSRWMGVFTFGLLAALAPLAQAQTNTGTVTGTVLDSSSGKYLEGAEVSVESQGVALRANTERGGAFTLSGVPTGAQTLVIAYPGLETKSQAIDVKAGQTMTVPITLTAETIMLEALTISTAKEGMSQAQALQKVSVQFKVVAANDQFGEISEGNIGEYLKFLPGVGIDYNSNDARGVSLRGLKTQFTIVAVDGTPMASAASGGDNRRFELEQIASNNIETYEVYKTMTPDLPADATGGLINMVTKSAFDRKDVSLFTYNLSLNVPTTRLGNLQAGSTWGNGAHLLVRPNIELNYARRVNEKIGLNFNYRLSEIYHDSPRSEYTWRYSGASLNGTTYSLANPTLLTYNQNNEQKLTHREAFATKLDYKISDSTKLTTMLQWNWYDLTFTQRGMLYTLSATTATSTLSNQANTPGANFSVSGPVSALTGARISNNTLQRRKFGTTLHGNMNLTHTFANDAKAWTTGYWSKANSKYRDVNGGFASNTAAYLNNITGFNVDDVLRNPDRPTVKILSFVAPSTPTTNIRDLVNYTANFNNSDDFRSRPDTAFDTKVGANAHYSLNLDGSIPVKFQAGGAYDIAEREIVRQTFRYTGITNPTGLLLDTFAEGSPFDRGFGGGPADVLDIYKIYDSYGRYGTKVLNSDDYRLFEEDNMAGYLLADAKFFQDLTVIGGVRWEKHTLDAKAQTRSSTRSQLAKYDIEYDNFYPSATLRYNPAFLKSWIFRAGASRTVGHPDYADVLPVLNAADSGANGNVTLADPNLEPYYVTNYDFAVDFYLGKTGVVTAAVFRKDVDGFIVAASEPVSSAAVQEFILDNGFDPATFSTATLRKNGLGSSVTGFELSYSQNFSFLPSIFKGLSLQTNYTKIEIEGDDLDTQYAQELAAVTESANVVLGYRLGRFNTLISNNWTGDKLIETPGAVNGVRITRYQSPEFKTNIKVEYSLGRHYNVYAELRNIFYEREEYFNGYATSDRDIYLPGRSFKYGDPIFVLGLKGTF